MPVFDKSTDYFALASSLNQRMKELQANLELQSDNYLQNLEQVVQSEQKLNKEIQLNEEKLLRKRDEKLSRKQLNKFM